MVPNLKHMKVYIVRGKTAIKLPTKESNVTSNFFSSLLPLPRLFLSSLPVKKWKPPINTM